AVRRHEPPPKIEETRPLKPEIARRLAGRYRADEKILDLNESSGRLWALPQRGGFRAELRSLDDGLIVDDIVAYGQKIFPEGDKLKIGKLIYEPVPVSKPAPAPAQWLG